MPSSNAEKCKNYRNRKKEAALKIKKPSKSSAERSRMYRWRKKQLAHGNKLAANEVLYIPSASNSQMTFESSPQPNTTVESYAKEPMDYQGISEVRIENNLGCIRWDDKLAVEKGLQTSGAEGIVVNVNNQLIENKRAQTCENLENLEIGVLIYRVYKYLQKEYEDLKALNASRRCDPSPLANILKRTAEATGVSELVVTAVVITHESGKEPPPDEILSEHNYHRRQSKREADVLRVKEEVLEEGSASGKSSEECGGSREEDAVRIKVEIAIDGCTNEGDLEECSRADGSRGNVEELTLKCEVFDGEEHVLPETTPPVAPPCQISKTPPEHQHDDSVCLKQIKIEPPEGKQTEQESIKSSPAKHQRAYSTRQKYNEMNARAVQSPEYRNRDDIKMEIEEYMFILSKPSDEPTTGDPITIKMEPQEYS